MHTICQGLHEAVTVCHVYAQGSRLPACRLKHVAICSLDQAAQAGLCLHVVFCAR